MPAQLIRRFLNHVVVSCGRKILDINSSKTAAQCLEMFRVSDVDEAVATRKDKRYVLSYSVVCEICSVCG